MDIGDNFFNSCSRSFIKKNPYISFILLSSFIEFLGKCMERRKDFQEDKHSKKDYYNVINSLQSLIAYKKFNDNSKRNSNYLYTHLRCGMLHALLPKDNLILSSSSNDINNNIIGAEELYSDLKKAWEELKKDPNLQSYLNSNQLVVKDNLTGSTTSQINQIVN